ncbi:hypothetical protein B296_00050463 [Ensete ventricosum]|uniref:Uncharacterized protein n=1 Tax=Ensete ventricosum TaxID=4639 RepID=A0A426XV87_ENSVE|nr:hypothetical protein B296_00050463 [Ensete ventricosum]
MESSIPCSHGGRALIVKGAEKVENAKGNSKYQDRAEGQRPRNFIRPIIWGCTRIILHGFEGPPSIRTVLPTDTDTDDDDDDDDHAKEGALTSSSFTDDDDDDGLNRTPFSLRSGNPCNDDAGSVTEKKMAIDLDVEQMQAKHARVGCDMEPSGTGRTSTSVFGYCIG